MSTSVVFTIIFKLALLGLAIMFFVFVGYLYLRVKVLANAIRTEHSSFITLITLIILLASLGLIVLMAFFMLF